MGAPWEDYAAPDAGAAGPWNAYAPPAPAAPAPAADTPAGLDWGDIGKGAVGGLERGVAGVAGLPGTIGNLTHKALAWAGVPEPAIAAAAGVARHAPMFSAFAGPDPQQIQRVLEPYTGQFYEPHTLAGQYVSTIGEFAPAALVPGGGGFIARALNTVVPAVASETAGQLTKGNAYEPYARAGAGLLGGIAGAKAITPAVAPEAGYQAAVNTLDAAGVPLTAGQRTGSRPIQWMESAAADMPFSGPAAQRLAGRTSAGYDRAITDQIFDRPALTRAGVPPASALPAPDVAAVGRQSLQDEYNRILGNNVLRADPQLMHDQYVTLANYERRALPSQQAGGSRDLAAIHNDILDHLVANNGSMAGDVYQETRSRLGTLADNSRTNDPFLARALTDTRNALDQAMARSMTPDDAAALQATNQRYALMRQTENAVARAGDHLSPAGVAQAVRAGRAGQYNQAAGALDPLVRAGSVVLKTLPNSGTAARLGAQQLFNLPQLVHAALVSGAASGSVGALFGWPGALLGAAAPHIAARLAVSRPVQAWLANQVLPQNLRDVLTQTLMQQQITLPGEVARNQRERADYDARRGAQLRASGLQ